MSDSSKLTVNTMPNDIVYTVACCLGLVLAYKWSSYLLEDFHDEDELKAEKKRNRALRKELRLSKQKK
jgi:hypothetical protein